MSARKTRSKTQPVDPTNPHHAARVVASKKTEAENPVVETWYELSRGKLTKAQKVKLGSVYKEFVGKETQKGVRELIKELSEKGLLKVGV